MLFTAHKIGHWLIVLFNEQCNKITTKIQCHTQSNILNNTKNQNNTITIKRYQFSAIFFCRQEINARMCAEVLTDLSNSNMKKDEKKNINKLHLVACSMKKKKTTQRHKWKMFEWKLKIRRRRKRRKVLKKENTLQFGYSMFEIAIKR